MRRLAAGLALSTTLASPARAQTRSVDAAVREFDAYATKAARDWGVPGLAIAVVRNDSVLLARGYGVRQLGAPGAVDEHTLFGIMSTTKAMTAAAVAMLVDEGKLGWDDPVSKWLPELQLADPYVTRELRVRDLLTHSAGLGNADRLWGRGDFGTAEILRRLRWLEPAYSFRSSFRYQNVMYGAAGEVIARASGTSYSEFLRARLFAPLGMTRSYPTHRAMAAARDANTSRAHYRIHDTVRVIGEDTVDALPAAGSVWSTVTDMARWARFLLDSARVNGQRLISARAFAQLFQPQVIVPDAEFYPTTRLTRPHWTTYGLGWFQQDYAGRFLAFHTGSLDGRTAIIGLVPDAHMGVVVLGNLDHAEVRHALMLRAVDIFAGGAPARDWSTELLALYGDLRRRADSSRLAADARRVAGTRASLPPAAYAGTYVHRVYGPIVVTETGGSLRLRAGVGSQNEAALSHWHYDTFRATYGDGRDAPRLVQFIVGVNGAVTRLLLGGSEELAFVRTAGARE
jgi:CubicO group peptidase (beta-lactamase class C family)